MVKTDADDDPIAVMSVLSTTKYKDKPFMKQIRQFLLDSCQGKTADMKATVEKVGLASTTAPQNTTVCTDAERTVRYRHACRVESGAGSR